MYFLNNGTVSVGYSLYLNGQDKSLAKLKLTYDMDAPCSFGGYYITRNLKS
jgi:hypothetical protein